VYIKHIHVQYDNIHEKSNQMSKEKKTIIRFQNYHRCSAILSGFFSRWVSHPSKLKRHNGFIIHLESTWLTETVLELCLDSDIATKVVIVFEVNLKWIIWPQFNTSTSTIYGHLKIQLLLIASSKNGETWHRADWWKNERCRWKEIADNDLLEKMTKKRLINGSSMAK
jgi:hypothetical protein